MGEVGVGVYTRAGDILQTYGGWYTKGTGGRYTRGWLYWG